MSSAEGYRTSNRHRLLHAGNDWLPTPQDCEGINPLLAWSHVQCAIKNFVVSV